ncbi:hypothetical protein BRPE64_ECDS00300 (plasmid) [Caballeronia insecticola]|uniref:Uncharacterized protein n=1 Tax=Caballeronia insecticola TaxID=758793 RepID=R4WUC3_9BURK|nr:hypothetical protein BRPE64_ECDS00300 [Caballeronia insecticola]
MTVDLAGARSESPAHGPIASLEPVCRAWHMGGFAFASSIVR